MGRLEKEFKVRLFQPGDEEGIVELLELVFNGWPKFDLRCSPLEHWKWKYQDNPLQTIQFTVGVSDNRIVGCNHYLPLKIKIGNNVYLSTQGLDVAVHSDFRRMALFNKMMDLGIKMRKEYGSQFHYYMTWNLKLKKQLSMYYHRFPHHARRLFRIHDVELQLRKHPMQFSFIYRYGSHLLKLTNKCRNALQPYRPPSYDFDIEKIFHFDERIEGFWEKIKEHYHFIVERSRDYLNWRYCDPRGGDYLVKIAQTDAKILGYMVLRTDRHQLDYAIGYIVDLLTLPNRIDVATALVENAISYFDGHHINMILCMLMKNHPYEAILKRNGFITKRERIPLFYKDYTEVKELERREIHSPSRIHLVYGDLDVI
jgi:hypothetical protein